MSPSDPGATACASASNTARTPGIGGVSIDMLAFGDAAYELVEPE